jgi:hypothetical protein
MLLYLRGPSYNSITTAVLCRLRGSVFETRVLRRIFGLKRQEIRGGWRKLHNEELHNLYPHQALLG